MFLQAITILAHRFCPRSWPLSFGIATGGWGLLACGIVGSIGGGAIGTWAGDRVYSIVTPEVESSVQATGILDAAELISVPAAPMCVAPLTR